MTPFSLRKKKTCFANGYFVNLVKEVLEKKAEDLVIFTSCHRNWNFLMVNFFLFIFKSLQISLLVYLFLPIFLLLNAAITSSYKHIYFCTVTTSHSSHPFPIFNLLFQKVFLQWSLFEIEWNKIYCFSFFEQSGICDKLIEQLQHSEGCDQRNRGLEAVAML